MLAAEHICFGAWDVSPWTLDHAMTFFNLVTVCLLAVSDASSAFPVLVTLSSCCSFPSETLYMESEVVVIPILLASGVQRNSKPTLGTCCDLSLASGGSPGDTGTCGHSRSWKVPWVVAYCSKYFFLSAGAWCLNSQLIYFSNQKSRVSWVIQS